MGIRLREGATEVTNRAGDAFWRHTLRPVATGFVHYSFQALFQRF